MLGRSCDFAFRFPFLSVLAPSPISDPTLSGLLSVPGLAAFAAVDPFVPLTPPTPPVAPPLESST